MEADIWTTTQPVPEWLSDRAKISGLRGDGTPELFIRRRNTGEIEILESGGKDVLVTMKSRDSWLLFSKTHPIMSVTPHQLELLYELHLRN